MTFVIIGFVLAGYGFFASGIFGALTGVACAVWIGSALVISRGGKDAELNNDPEVRRVQQLGGIVAIILSLSGAIVGGWQWGWIWASIGYWLAVGGLLVVAIIINHQKQRSGINFKKQTSTKITSENSNTINPSNNMLRRSSQSPTKAKAKILHFEDDSFMSGMYLVKFPKEGFDYVTYTSPSLDPVKIVLEEKPDLIIMDILMPIMEGFTATKLLKADKRTANIPILGLCNLGQDADIQKARELGMVDYLVSVNVTPSGVVQRVREIVSNAKP